MPKTKLGVDVLTATKERIAFTFDNFERIYISFSGGKDSTLMLHLVMDEAIKRKKKVGVLFIDLEGQYKLTIEHIKTCLKRYEKYIELYWICLPIHLRNGVSTYEPFWVCWDKEKEKAWIREPPKEAITDVNYFPFFYEGMEFEEFVPLFGEWFSKGKKTACFVGIRSDESLNRFRTIASKYKTPYKNKQWTTGLSKKLFNVYPIYDWKTEDVWVYHARNKNKEYNYLYEMMHKAGLSISQQRICQPYGDDQRRGLWLFHLIEPETWGKVVNRVNGANAGAIYIREKGNFTGYRKICKPKQHTWKSFAMLLLSSMPPKTKEHFRIKIFAFVQWWEKVGGYKRGIPDEADAKLEAKKLAPSWRRICKSLLRNDFWCKGIGYTQHKSEAYRKYIEMKKRRGLIWKESLN